MIRLTLESLQQTLDLGRRLGGLAELGDVFALDGELGAGKTQLVRGLAEGMGLDPRQVSSPTFVIMHEYEPDERASAPPPPTLVHVDAYRLSSGDELRELGFDDELLRTSVTAVEWASRLSDPRDGEADWSGVERRLSILLQHAGQGSRQACLDPGPGWRRRLRDLSFG